MIAITTSNSIRVKPPDLLLRSRIFGNPLAEFWRTKITLGRSYKDFKLLQFNFLGSQNIDRRASQPRSHLRGQTPASRQLEHPHAPALDLEPALGVKGDRLGEGLALFVEDAGG